MLQLWTYVIEAWQLHDSLTLCVRLTSNHHYCSGSLRFCSWARRHEPQISGQTRSTPCLFVQEISLTIWLVPPYFIEYINLIHFLTSILLFIYNTCYKREGSTWFAEMYILPTFSLAAAFKIDGYISWGILKQVKNRLKLLCVRKDDIWLSFQTRRVTLLWEMYKMYICFHKCL